MTKKDYKLIAGAIYQLPFKTNILQVASALAAALGKDDPKFNSEKFLQAALRDV